MTDTTQPTMSDRLMINGLIRLRKLHNRVVNEGREDGYRRRRMPTSPPPRLVPACHKYKKLGWLPPDLLTIEKLPREAWVPPRYFLGYYGTGKALWTVLERRTLSTDVPWRSDFDWNDAFNADRGGWRDPTSDATFVRLRLQGPNPFLLRRREDDLDGSPAFVLDFSGLFEGVFDPVVATFVVRDGGLEPHTVDIGSETVHRGDERWDDAKRIVNGLDVRYAVFGRHLLNCHLMVGDAYAIAAYHLADWHPLRSFVDYFTYGTLLTDAIAYSTLLPPSSYFRMSNFVSGQDARQIMLNAREVFDYGEWNVPLDIAKRGIDAIPGHPYVADAQAVWPVLEKVVRRRLDDLHIDDEEVRADVQLRTWYDTLCRILPSKTIPALASVENLVDLLTRLLYNNVVHEVCGNFAPLFDSKHPADKVGVNFDHLRALARGEQPPPPLMNEVFLMDQAAYVTKFNVAGNKMMTMNPARFIDDPKLLEGITDLQKELRDLDAKLAAVRPDEPVPFSMMRPSRWEASISF